MQIAWARTALVVLGVAVASCGGSQEATPTAAVEEQTDAGLSSAQRRRADQLVSAFENSTTDIRYDYAENLGDGRGVTAGRAGFTTATCDALAVIEIYTERVAENELARFTDELERLCDENNDDTTGLPESDYIAAWRVAAEDERFRSAQDAVVDREYYDPAMEAADDNGVRTALARAQLYDAAIQHGAGDDPDGLYALIDRTNERVGSPEEAGEQDWLDAFFDVRIETLNDPANAETAEAWRESVDRVECMRRIAETYGHELDGPITFSVYGDEFSID